MKKSSFMMILFRSLWLQIVKKTVAKLNLKKKLQGVLFFKGKKEKPEKSVFLQFWHYSDNIAIFFVWDSPDYSNYNILCRRMYPPPTELNQCALASASY